MPCAHAACSCAETTVKKGGRSFCSEECASPAGSRAECDCGHPGCKGAGRRENRGESRSSAVDSGEFGTERL